MTNKKKSQQLLRSVRFEYLVAFLSMVLIILGAVAGERLYPSKSAQTTESEASENALKQKPLPTNQAELGFCSHFGFNEARGIQSQLVKINSTLGGVNLIKTYACTDSACDFEAIESKNGTIFAISNSTKTLYQVDSTDGSLSNGVVLNPQLNISGISFRNSDGTLWAWAPGKGLYTLDTQTGILTLKVETIFSGVEDIAWNNEGTALYLSKSPENQLYIYNETEESIDFQSLLPGKTIALNFPPADYASGQMIGIAKGGEGQLDYFYTYDVTKGVVITKYPIKSEFANIDSLALCI